MRFVDWDIRLIEFAAAVKGMPFEWGNTNCAALAAGAVDAMLGTDHFAAQRALDLSEERAREMSNACETRKALLDAGLMPVENPRLAQRGDIIYAVFDGWECVHVVVGKYALSSTMERGVCFVRLSGLLAMDGVEVFRCPQ
ncbi:DUF6950 family protein [Pontiella sp.]|uniref:DUF6950 family protein n=1 Tax=Pontiella sp. TaxID=2837462 RepID=UPI0035616439